MTALFNYTDFILFGLSVMFFNNRRPTNFKILNQGNM